MYKIRQVKYAINSVSIQVYKIENRKRVIVRHIGTARNEQEKSDLLILANDFIEKASKQLHLFGNNETDHFFYVNQIEFIGVYYTFLYELVSKLIITIGFDKLKNSLLVDLVMLRMVEPASKLRSIELLEEYFGIKHRRQSYYQSAPQWLALKSKAETIALEFAKSIMASNLICCFMMLLLYTLKPLRKTNFVRTDFLKTANRSSLRF